MLKKSNQTLHNPTKRVTDILELLSKTSIGHTLKEISDTLNIPQSTISPILQTLCKTQFIMRNEYTLKFSIGVTSFMVGYSFINSLDILEIIKKHMRKIVKETDEICQLGILNEKDVLYIAKVEPTQPIKLESHVGKTFPAHTTALGKALLSKYDDEKIRSLYSQKMKKLTEKTISDVNILIKEIQYIRANYIAEESGENNREVRCVAVPLIFKGYIFASISISIPIYRSSDEKIESIENCLLKYKDSIEKELSNINIEISDINFIKNNANTI